jgi:hypothetical protein
MRGKTTVTRGRPNNDEEVGGIDAKKGEINREKVCHEPGHDKCHGLFSFLLSLLFNPANELK